MSKCLTHIAPHASNLRHLNIPQQFKHAHTHINSLWRTKRIHIHHALSMALRLIRLLDDPHDPHDLLDYPSTHQPNNPPTHNTLHTQAYPPINRGVKPSYIYDGKLFIRVSQTVRTPARSSVSQSVSHLVNQCGVFSVNRWV